MIFCNYSLHPVLEVIQSISIILASLTALYGLISWQVQAKWKRQYELAEEILYLFYEAKDNIEAIRSAFSHPSEGKSRERKENESKEIAEILDSTNIPYERYLKYQDSFNKLKSIKYRCMSIFDPEKGKLFDDLNKIVFNILNNAQFLCWLEYDKIQGGVELNDYINRKNEYLSVLWAGYSLHKKKGDDKIRIEVDNLIKEVEGFCKPIIQKRNITLFG